MTAVGKMMLVGLVVLSVGSFAWAAPAEDGAGDASVTEAPKQAVTPPAEPQSPPGINIGSAIAMLGACFGAGMCAIGGGLAIAKIGSQCIDAIARQPEAASSMFAPMIISAAMAEGGMLFAIVVCLWAVMSA